ncbi:MAG: NADH-quinone oxidoreductase subunit D [Solirubrobacteraceae bacterium]
MRARRQHASRTQSELPDYVPARLGAEREEAPANELRLRVTPLALERSVRLLRDAGARFVTMLLAQDPQPAIMVALALRGDLVVLRAPTAGAGPVSYGSLGAVWPAARWSEQELVEREGVSPVGYDADRRLTAPDPDLLAGSLAGLDVFALPYGPVRSGIFEAIQFMIETAGESVPRLQTRPFFKHRGMQSRFEGLDPGAAVCVAERVAGIASVAYASAFSHAVERALCVEPPASAERWRAVHAELERIACHLDVIAKQAETTALSVGQARFQILKERVMRLRARLTGSRFGRGVIVPGGVRHEGLIELDVLLAELDQLERDLVVDRRLFLATSSMTDRLIGSGVLGRELVDEYAAVGPLARGSGLSVDARHERPYGEYRRLGLRVVTERAGDAMARVNVRFGEIDESLRILRQAIDHLRRRNGQQSVALPGDGSGSAFGWAEAPQGELVVWVEINGGLVRRARIASPSLRNWALFNRAFPKDVLTDFAFIEHSFGLTAAGADR